MKKAERQIKEAFIDGWLSAADRYSHLSEDHLRYQAELAWVAENVTAPE